MKTGIETALKTLEIMLEEPEKLMQAASNEIGRGKRARELLEAYIKLSGMPEWKYAIEEKTLLLKPDEITEFFEKSKAYKSGKLYREVISDFTIKLIQHSYRNRGNNFLIDTSKIIGLEWLLSLDHDLQGAKTKPLIISVKGDAGRHFCSGASYCNITLEDGRYTYGINARGCTFRTQNKKLAESIVQNMKSAAKERGFWWYKCKVRDNDTNKVYIIGKKNDELFWDENNPTFMREVEEHSAWEASRRGPDYMEPD